MKFSRVYRETMKFWPSVIDISDGELLDHGGYFPVLSNSWKEAEGYGHLWSEWHQLMVWAIFCGLHKAACSSFRTGAAKIYKQEIDKDYVQHKFSESLYAVQPSYPRQMRRAYVNDLKRNHH